jgi:hypothetical protein
VSPVTCGSPKQAPNEATNALIADDMVIWVKTTIDIASGLLEEAKERARREGTTLRALVERGLSEVLGEPMEPNRPPFVAVTGRLEPLSGVDPNDGESTRASIYDAADRD